MSSAFEKISAGLKDAIDGNIGRAHTFLTSPFSPPVSSHDIAQLFYNKKPTMFQDRVDGDCRIVWEQAAADNTPEATEALRLAVELINSPNPSASLIELVGKDGLLSEMASFTWFHGTEWFVETRFGNFYWRDPDYGDGDNSFTFFEGDYKQFLETVVKLDPGIGRNKGRHLIGTYCGENIELKIPQLDK